MMITHSLLQPQILGALARLGHGSRILIADGNYPFATARGSNAEVVYLNITPGLPTVMDVLEPLKETVPIEDAAVMALPDGAMAELCGSYVHVLGQQNPLRLLERFDFYEQARGRDVGLVIATADQGICANLLLTIGVRS